MKAIFVWLMAMFQKLTGGLPAVETEEMNGPGSLRLDLQFFAEKGDGDDDDDAGDDQDGDGDDGDDDDGDDDDDTPNLDELLKDPAFKKQYNAKMKEQLGKRMKKHERQLEKLKGAAGQDKGGKGGADDEPDEESKTEARLARAERREKRALVKEYAADHGHSPKLLARLINIDDIELDDDGDPENLDELIEELEEEFPELFGAGTDDDADEEERPAKKRFTPGAKQKGNKKKKPDPVALAMADIQRRHGKKKED